MVGLCWVPKFVPKFFLGFQFSLRLLSWNTTETAHGTRKSWQLNLALSRSHRAELMPTDAVAPIDSEQSEANDDRENILDFHVLHFLSFLGDPMGPLYLVYQDNSRILQMAYLFATNIKRETMSKRLKSGRNLSVQMFFATKWGLKMEGLPKTG